MTGARSRPGCSSIRLQGRSGGTRQAAHGLSLSLSSLRGMKRAVKPISPSRLNSASRRRIRRRSGRIPITLRRNPVPAWMVTKRQRSWSPKPQVRNQTACRAGTRSRKRSLSGQGPHPLQSSCGRRRRRAIHCWRRSLAAPTGSRFARTGSGAANGWFTRAKHTKLQVKTNREVYDWINSRVCLCRHEFHSACFVGAHSCSGQYRRSPVVR